VAFVTPLPDLELRPETLKVTDRPATALPHCVTVTVTV
jgi:hypothetical protein